MNATTPVPDSPAHDHAGDSVFDLHLRGKMEISSTVPLRDRDDLSMAYTPGVARVCEAIAAEPALTRDYTWVANAVAVVTDGTAVLGLGDIGPSAAMPVMEGKAVLFKQFGGVDAVPICLDTKDTDEIVETVARLAPSFGGINLEDISAPRCFEIEGIDVGEALEEDRLALHHRLRGERAKVAETEDRGAIGDDADEITLRRVVERAARILGDREHRHGDSRRIGEREIPLGRHRLCRNDLELSRPALGMKQQRLLVREGRPRTAFGGVSFHGCS